MNRKQMQEQIKKILKDLDKKGLDVEKATEGKSIEKLAFNSATFNNFLKRVKRVEERPKIIEENKKNDEKRRKRLELEFNRKRVTNETKNIVKATEKFKPNRNNIKLKTQSTAHDFLSRYFQELTLDAKGQKEINKLAKRFGNRLDILYDVMENEELLQFKYPFPKELLKKGLDDELRMIYHEHMYERLDVFKKNLEIEYGI